MGLDEAVETIAAILTIAGGLPFVMAWLERTLDADKAPPAHWWHRAATRSPAGTTVDARSGRRRRA